MSATATKAQTQTWEIDALHTHIEFSVRHMMISTVKGRFTKVAGRVTVDPSDPTTADLDVRIDAASIDTGVGQRDDHLRSADFLDVANFPFIGYHAHHVDRLADGALRVHGDLTIHGVTRHVVLALEEQGRVLDPYGNERAGFSATAKINRKDFGLTWNQALETGGVVVADEVKVGIEVELVRLAAERAA